MKNPEGVGTPADVIMGTVFPMRLCIIRKVSGFAKIKKTRVLYKLYLTFRRNWFIENPEMRLLSLSPIYLRGGFNGWVNHFSIIGGFIHISSQLKRSC
jgi:hypothetical protein